MKLDFYDIKLPAFIGSYCSGYSFRDDVPKRETYRFDFLCELYKLELKGCGEFSYFKINTNLLQALEGFEKLSDNPKYRKYLKYLRVEDNA